MRGDGGHAGVSAGRPIPEEAGADRRPSPTTRLHPELLVQPRDHRAVHQDLSV